MKIEVCNIVYEEQSFLGKLLYWILFPFIAILVSALVIVILALVIILILPFLAVIWIIMLIKLFIDER